MRTLLKLTFLGTLVLFLLSATATPSERPDIVLDVVNNVEIVPRVTPHLIVYDIEGKSLPKGPLYCHVTGANLLLCGDHLLKIQTFQFNPAPFERK